MMTSTVGEMPGAYIEAVGTATAIAPAIAATVSFNRDVIPTVQAVEALESVETVETREENARTVSTMWAIVRVSVLAVVAIGVSIWFSVQVGASFWERCRRAWAFVPYQKMPELPVFFPGWKTLVDPRTGMVALVSETGTANIEHGHLLIERQIAKTKPGAMETAGSAIVGILDAVQRYRFTWRQGDRHPLTEREIIEVK